MSRLASRVRSAAVLAAVTALPFTVGAPAHADTPPASVVQNDIPVVTGGSTTPAVARFTATLPASVHGQVNARLHFNGAQLPPAGYTADRVAARLHSTCAVNGKAAPCAWHGGEYGTLEQGNLILDLPSTTGPGTTVYTVSTTADLQLIPWTVRLFGDIQLSSPDGAPIAVSDAEYIIDPGTVEARLRPALYARDKAGVLWRYEGTGRFEAPFASRTRVGGGWQIYTGVTSLNGTTAAGTGDLVARDRSGVLWYYRGTGNPAAPFAPRVRIGGGWQIYTALAGAGGPVSAAAGGGDLVARDASGVLWLYRATGGTTAPFAPRVRIGGGWNAYDTITTYGNGVVARDGAGVLWSYTRGGALYAPRVRVSAGWQIYTVVAGVRNATGSPYSEADLVARDASGELWFYVPRGSTPPTRTPVGGGWNIYDLLV